MGVGLLKDAAVKERRRRLLAGADMTAAERRPRLAQIGALVNGERQTHRRLAATASASGDERRGSETLMASLHRNALHYHSRGLQHTAEQEDARTFLHVEGPLCNNVLSESRPHAELTGAALIDGERQTRRRTATSSNEETRGPETLLTGLHTNALHSSSAVAGTFMVEKQDARTFLSESRPRAQLTGAALVDGGCQTHHHAVTTTSDEAVGLQQMKQQSGRRFICPRPGEQEDANFLEIEGPLCSNVVSESRRPQAQLTSAALVDGGCQTHRRFVVGDATESDSVLVSIFLRHAHVSGGLVLTVNLDEPSQQMMCLYAQKTNTKLELQYFIFGKKMLEPDSTLLSYGVRANSTIHVCSRLLGGVDGLNLQDYINNNQLNFVEVVLLPNGCSSLQMTILGCQFFSSWIRCFTAAFSKGKSWNGEFELVDFKFVEGHVCYIKRPTRHVKSSSVGADIRKFADIVKNIFQFSQPSDKPKLVSKYPPYVEACMKILEDLVGSGVTGPLTTVTGALSNEYKLLLDTLVCCMTSYARERLVIELFRKYEAADENEASIWCSAINAAACPDRKTLLKSQIFEYFIQQKNGTSKPYSKDKTGTFVLLKDVVMHAADSNGNPNAPKLGDAVELMIPFILKDFLPEIIKNLIEKKIDISAELLAAIRCACSICDSSQ